MGGQKNILNIAAILLSALFLSACSSNYIPLNQVDGYDAIISSYNSPPSMDKNGGYVVVKKGDTLYSIGKRYNVSTRSLIYANNLSSPYTLKIGQKIYLPSSAFHTVKKGDTLYGISRQYNVDSRSLAKINNIKYPYSIYQGQKLLLPSAIERKTNKNKVKKETTKKTAASPTKKTTTKTSTKTTNKNKSQNVAKSTSTANSTKTTVSKKPSPIPAPPPRAGGKFAWPHDGKILLGFGDVGAGSHNDGINIKAKEGDNVKAADNGVVAYAGNELKGFGNLILIKHSDGWITAYAHNSKILVKKNQTVKKGQVIAKAGQTGNVQSPQVHFEVRQKSKAKDPVLYLEKRKK